jgi:hypothetical protein
LKKLAFGVYLSFGDRLRIGFIIREFVYPTATILPTPQERFTELSRSADIWANHRPGFDKTAFINHAFSSLVRDDDFSDVEGCPHFRG